MSLAFPTLRLLVIGSAALLAAGPAGPLTTRLLGAPPQQPSPVQKQIQAPAAVSSAPMTKTVLVPQTTYKTITQEQVVLKPVLREKTVPVTRMVSENQTL